MNWNNFNGRLGDIIVWIKDFSAVSANIVTFNKLQISITTPSVPGIYDAGMLSFRC